MNNKKIIFIIFFTSLSLGLYACSSQSPYQRASSLFKEPDWIKNNEPIIYMTQNWYPTENVENLKDDEVECVYEYNKTPVYVEKVQIKPYNRFYTKFGRNKYRLFTKNDIK